MSELILLNSDSSSYFISTVISVVFIGKNKGCLVIENL